jgi:aspartate kinase
MKFGGTSVGNAEAMRQTADLILNTRSAWGSVVVIASAMGSKPIKVTDLLLNGALAARQGDEETFRHNARLLREVHYEAIDGLLSPEHERQQVLIENEAFIAHYEALCHAVLVLGELTPRALDVIGGMGERMSVRILAAYLRELGHAAEAIDATELIVTDSHFQAASPFFPATRQKSRARLGDLLARGGIPIVTGFIAADQDGVQTTLGRGGSDYSAAILGDALAAREVWIWTDVDGVMSADPRLVSEAQSIPALTWREISELAYYGAQVLHPKTIRPVVESGIPLRIKNTFSPDHPGTVIVQEGGDSDGVIKAVTAIKKLCLITLEGKGMLGVPGIAARTFGAVAREAISVLLITQASSEQSICFATSQQSADSVRQALEKEFSAEISARDIDRVRVQQPVAIVTVVGAGMLGIPGIAGRVFSSLGQAQLNIIAIAQGSSECSISLVVAEADSSAAVQQIHRLIVG